MTLVTMKESFNSQIISKGLLILDQSANVTVKIPTENLILQGRKFLGQRMSHRN